MSWLNGTSFSGLSDGPLFCSVSSYPLSSLRCISCWTRNALAYIKERSRKPESTRWIFTNYWLNLKLKLPVSFLPLERTSFSRGLGTLKQQLSIITPVLEDLRSKKDDRIRDSPKFVRYVMRQSNSVSDAEVIQNDLTIKKLGDLKSHLHELQNEKLLRQQKGDIVPSTERKQIRPTKYLSQTTKTKKLQFVNLQYKRIWWEAGKRKASVINQGIENHRE